MMNKVIHHNPLRLAVDLEGFQRIDAAFIPQLLILGGLLYAQCYLLLAQPSKRRLRSAIWPCATFQILNVWLRYRFFNINYIIFNFVIGCSAIYMLVKSAEWAFLRDPPTRIPPLQSRTARSAFLDALHLLTSTRMIGWSTGSPLGDPSATSRGRSMTGDAGGFAVRRQTDKGWERRELVRNIKGLLVHYLCLDVVMFMLHHFGGRTVGNVGGGSVSVARENFFEYIFGLASPLARILPSTTSSVYPLVFRIVSLSFSTILRLLVGLEFYHALALGNCIVTILGMTLVGQSAQEWPRFSDRPWRATSNFDFWGKRWHQLFRQVFIAPTRLLPNRFRPLATPIFAFTISAAMHDIGQITMAGSTSPNFSVTLFFICAALGMSAEMVFHKVTGRRVAGRWGWTWLWSYLLWTSGLVVEPWLDIGVGGASFFPDSASLARLLYRLVMGTEAAQNDLGVSMRNEGSGAEAEVR